MKHPAQLALQYAVGSDVGVVRDLNEDSVLASPRLLAVADGMGGHAHGEIASAAVIGVLVELDERLRAAEQGEVEPLEVLDIVVATALRRITKMAANDPDLTLMGTTLTALLWNGTGFGLAHVGDSRGYLLHDGELRQITTDHTLVQSLVDEGRISQAEAAEHPRRSMLIRALQAGGAAEPDLTLLPAAAGDRYLLCSDGLTCVVGEDMLRHVLCTAEEPAAAVHLLIEEAKRLDSPDNISCVVIDVMTSLPVDDVLIAGAALDIQTSQTKHPDPTEHPDQAEPTGPTWLPRWARRLSH